MNQNAPKNVHILREGFIGIHPRDERIAFAGAVIGRQQQNGLPVLSIFGFERNEPRFSEGNIP
ncbi:MAG: hypothetical protein ACE5PV_13405 [Candidatus Poribacteria bacterium]